MRLQSGFASYQDTFFRMSNLTTWANTSAAITAQVSSESEGLLLDEVAVDLSVGLGTSPLIDDPDDRSGLLAHTYETGSSFVTSAVAAMLASSRPAVSGAPLFLFRAFGRNVLTRCMAN
jgi:hypothetical protein